MPNDISAAASPACAMIRVGVCSAVTTWPDPSVNDHGPDDSAGASGGGAAEPQPASATLATAAARTERQARMDRPFSCRMGNLGVR
jgi:hypothetical protein